MLDLATWCLASWNVAPKTHHPHNLADPHRVSPQKNLWCYKNASATENLGSRDQKSAQSGVVHEGLVQVSICSNALVGVVVLTLQVFRSRVSADQNATIKVQCHLGVLNQAHSMSGGLSDDLLLEDTGSSRRREEPKVVSSISQEQILAFRCAKSTEHAWRGSILCTDEWHSILGLKASDQPVHHWYCCSRCRSQTLRHS